MADDSAVWEVFSRLFAAYGPRGWWPVTPSRTESPVYRPGVYLPACRAEQVEIAAGAVLTQNTSWKNAAKAVSALKRRDLLDPERLCACDKEALRELIRSSGYFRQKADRLRILAAYLVEYYARSRGSGLSCGEFRGSLLALRGIGPETADSILLYAFGHAVFVVDAYTRRLVTRLGWFRKDPGYEALQTHFETALPPGIPLYNEYHALIVQVGKTHCAAKPRCDGCPLRECCRIGGGA